MLYDSPGLTIQGQVNLPALPGGADDRNGTSTWEKERSSHVPHPSSSDYKTVAHSVFRVLAFLTHF